MVLGGGYITILGFSPYSANPLLVITGLTMITYGIVKFCIGAEFTDKKPKVLPAHPCRQSNHAGCQDSPDCVCGCHRERIEIKVRAY